MPDRSRVARYYSRFSGYGAAARRERVARTLERVGLAGAADAGLAERATRTGTPYRLELPEADLYAVLEQLRGSNARILSVSQVRPTRGERVRVKILIESAGGQSLSAAREIRRSFVQGITQKGSVDLKPAIVVNEAQFPEFIHEKLDLGARCINQFG